MIEAFRIWSKEEETRRPELIRLGYFGSYARGDWGVGSDLDVIAIVKDSSEPFDRRGIKWHLESLPVPTEIIIYSKEEWNRLNREQSLFFSRLNEECVWITDKILKGFY